MVGRKRVPNEPIESSIGTARTGPSKLIEHYTLYINAIELDPPDGTCVDHRQVEDSETVDFCQENDFGCVALSSRSGWIYARSADRGPDVGHLRSRYHCPLHAQLRRTDDDRQDQQWGDDRQVNLPGVVELSRVVRTEPMVRDPRPRDLRKGFSRRCSEFTGKSGPEGGFHRPMARKDAGG